MLSFIKYSTEFREKKNQGNLKQSPKDSGMFYLIYLNLSFCILALFSPYYLREKPYCKIAVLLEHCQNEFLQSCECLRRMHWGQSWLERTVDSQKSTYTEQNNCFNSFFSLRTHTDYNSHILFWLMSAQSFFLQWIYHLTTCKGDIIKPGTYCGCVNTPLFTTTLRQTGTSCGAIASWHCGICFNLVKAFARCYVGGWDTEISNLWLWN